MSTDWENKFRLWTKKPSDTEEAMCENAERMIRNAIRNDDELSKINIEIFAQGSYSNNTNVKQNSDVDICIRYMDSYFCDFPNGKNKSDFGFVDSKYTFSNFKDDVERALINKFGTAGVTKGNKAFDVHSNTYRVDADVVACFEHRRYNGNGQNYLSGTEFRSEDGTEIINWPKQHYENGVRKNTDTNRRYKKVVRILRRLNVDMQDDGIEVSHKIPSFLIECLIWNTPNNIITNTNYVDTIKNTLVFLYQNTTEFEKCSEWREVSELKYLFRSSQPWNFEDVNKFTVGAWNYIGY